MRVFDIINLGMEYLTLGIFVAVLAGIGFALWYFLYFKKKRPGEKFHWWKMLLWGIFLVYLVVVFGATMLSRGSFYGNEKIYPLFYSYKDAWNDFSMTEWRNIILNILMFVPFGFFVPILSKKMNACWKVYLMGFAVTCVIETIQLVFNRGVFEPDDLMGNTLGTMIGYGIYCIGKYFVAKRKKERRESFGGVLSLQLPLLVVVAAFSTFFIAYQMKELGNISDAYIVKQKNIFVTSEQEFADEAPKATVYKASVLTVEETEKLAKELFAKQGLGIDQSRTDIYENSAFYYSDGGNRFNVWFEYDGGVFSFYDFERRHYGQEDIPVKTDANENEIRLALSETGIFVPDVAVFENKGEGAYRFTADKIVDGAILYDGYVECEFYEDGKCGSIEYQILTLDSYKEFDIISEKEAYEELQDGKFSYWRENNDVVNMVVEDVRLGYRLDTKGFYQPVYIFSTRIGENEWDIMIPAIK